MNDRRLRVLIIAHELSPFSGSECAVGWNLVTRIALYHDITVIYASGSQAKPDSYKTAIEHYFRKNPTIPGLDLINADQPLLTRFTATVNKLFKKIGPIGLPLLYYLGYRSWQRNAFTIARDLHFQSPFDAVHQITQITYREPGYVWKLHIPFFWGPTGGVANMPFSYYKYLSFGSKTIEGIRFISNKYQSCCMRRIRKAISRSAVIYTYSKEDAVFFAAGSPRKIRQMLDVGTTKPEYFHKMPRAQKDILEGVWCGQLTYRKAPEIFIRALAAGDLTRQKISLTVIGEGPLEKALLKLANQLQLKNITWIRRIPHKQVFEIMKEADFLIHTSLREATSSVIPEALSVGLPVLCHDVNGMGIAVDGTCGLKIPLVSPSQSIQGFHDAMKNLILDREYLARLKNGALNRAEELSWDNMAKVIAYDYNVITEEKSSK